MIGFLLGVALITASGQELPGQWTVKQAREWGNRQQWITGCNYIPASAINQLEMWQAATFSPAAIEREFGLLGQTGMRAVRVYLHDVAYEADPGGFKSRMKTLLALAKAYEIQVIFVFFDDCWNAHCKTGEQPAPVPGVHNSGWLRSPSDDRRTLPSNARRLKTYVQDILKTFRNEKSVWMWDLFNEPGNSGYGKKSGDLLQSVFAWAREVRPKQPLTAGSAGAGGNDLDPDCLQLSDVVTFHCYGNASELENQIKFYQKFDRPIICTEWMARTNDSRILTHLPIFQKHNVSCLQWGFVSGKTNTIFPWGSAPNSPEPAVWFHDLYRNDGTPFDTAEIDLYRRLNKAKMVQASMPQRLPVVSNTQGISGLRRLADFPLRDPSICRGPDGVWYLTGTVEPFYGFNEGIQVRSSADFKEWKPLGFVWKYGSSPWHKPYFEKKMSLWAPEIHYLKGTFWLTYSMPGYGGDGATSGCGLLRSTTGKPEGPYVDMHPSARLGDEIDASLFEDTDGAVYFVWHSGKIAKLKPDMSGFDGAMRLLKTKESDTNPNHHTGLCERIFGKGSLNHVGYEGACLLKRDGVYYLIGSDMIDGRYSCMVATSKSIYGPYSARYEAIPHGGHSMFFKDEIGEYWSTYFGSDSGAPWQEKPGILPVRFGTDGKILMDFR
ncbi:MAG: family 43 glycosylhydrolase [Fimbriimonadaceae bacterium]